MTEADVRKMITSQARLAGSRAALAVALGISPAYLGDVVNGRQAPGDKILKQLGLERVIRYRKRNGT